MLPDSATSLLLETAKPQKLDLPETMVSTEPLLNTSMTLTKKKVKRKRLDLR